MSWFQWNMNQQHYVYTGELKFHYVVVNLYMDGYTNCMCMCVTDLYQYSNGGSLVQCLPVSLH